MSKTNQSDTSLSLETLAARLEQSEARYRRAELRLRLLGGLLLGGMTLTVTLPVVSPAVAQGYGVTLAQLLTRVVALETKTASMSVLTDPFTDKPTVRFDGVNVQVVSGSNDTTGPVNGTGNLIIGYNEAFKDGSSVRTGSHNLVLGNFNSYSSAGGTIAGQANSISGLLASVYGGFLNQATGSGATVTGGSFGTASGIFSTVSGGGGNTASGQNSAVSGGNLRTVTGTFDWQAGALFQNQ